MTENTRPTPTTTSSKSNKAKTLTIVLKLKPTALAQYPGELLTRKPSKAKPAIAVTSPDASSKHDTPDEVNTGDATPVSDSTRKAEDGSLAPPEVNGLKRKATSDDGPTPPKKDKTDDNGNPKPRGKPGPKRRKGLPDGEATIQPSHKLGPKANQGAINAQLRALDRTGKPSRRWQHAPFSFTSFTGHKWELPQWNTAKLYGAELNGDGNSDNTGSSEAKGGQHSSAVASENGQGVGTPSVVPDIASSPPPMPAALESAPASSVAAA